MALRGNRRSQPGSGIEAICEKSETICVIGGMKAKVIVRLKDGVLDPQGQTIQRSLNKMGHEVTELRQGKYFEIEINGLKDESAVRQRVEKIAADVLCNPIIEIFEIEDIA
jgi:phosphoribosylformylglycinamidine synthase